MNEGEVVLTPEQIQTLRGYASVAIPMAVGVIWLIWVTVMRMMLLQLS
ncbi:iron-regulated FrpC domain protein, partial [Neisseria meningitidis NM23]